MTFRFRLMSQADAESIAAQQYPDPFFVYDWAADPNDLAELLDPKARGDGYFAVEDEDGSLIGFFHYKTPHGPRLQIGLGLHPERTGQGLGKSFVEPARLRPRAVRRERVHALRRQLQSARDQGVRARRLLCRPRLHALDEWCRVGVRGNGTTRLGTCGSRCGITWRASADHEAVRARGRYSGNALRHALAGEASMEEVTRE
jgi:GNAT superfamily N-acetyltransferase